MNLEACLPLDLQGPDTTIMPMSNSFSGAGVYRVDANGRQAVLKIHAEGKPPAEMRRRIHMQHVAADASLAPRILHVDETRRAVVSEFIADRLFAAFYMNPATHDAALIQLGRLIRQVHHLPMPTDADAADPRQLLTDSWARLEDNVAIPPFVADVVHRALAEDSPVPEHPIVLSHNDVHPANLIFDSEKLFLVDWDVAAPNDPFYDLASIAMFLRMDDENCRKLLSAYDKNLSSTIPTGFNYYRRFVAAFAGASFLNTAFAQGYASGHETLTIDTTPSLAQFYQRMMSGAVSLATAEGQWWFGLALIKASAEL